MTVGYAYLWQKKEGIVVRKNNYRISIKCGSCQIREMLDSSFL